MKKQIYKGRTISIYDLPWKKCLRSGVKSPYFSIRRTSKGRAVYHSWLFKWENQTKELNEGMGTPWPVHTRSGSEWYLARKDFEIQYHRVCVLAHFSDWSQKELMIKMILHIHLISFYRPASILTNIYSL